MKENEKNNVTPEEFNRMVPRSIIAEANPDRLDKTAQTFTGGTGYGFNNSIFAAAAGSSYNIMRSPSRRFYDPEITTTAIYLPRNIRQKNRWCRWFFDHDEMVGHVLELHAELPHSRAELILDDHVIKKHIEDCFDKTKFFSMLPVLDLEFMKIGEVFIHTPWDSTAGMWTHIIPHNPDFVEVTATPFADTECVIEIKPDDELKKIIHSTKPEEQQLKKRLPKDVVRRVLTGKNILLNPEEVTHLARRSNPYDIRGTSLLNRIFRLLMYEDKLREAQITIADNFIYPLKVFKLGDPNKGWIPDESHQRALAQMLQQAHFDPNFALIYHYGLNIDYVTVADKVMRLEKEYQEISERKMIALGISKNFMQGEQSYACFTKGTNVITPKGICAIENIKKNDFVIDKDGTAQRVINNWCEGTPETVTKINLWGGKEIICTSEHKWPVWAWPRTCACGCGRPIKPGKAFAHSIGKSKRNLKQVDVGRATVKRKYIVGVPKNYNPLQNKEAAEIKEWDYLMIPRKFDEIKTDVSAGLSRLLGYFIASENENKWIDDVTNLCSTENIPISSISNKQGAAHLRSVTQRTVRDKVKWFKKHAGEYAHEKKLSEEVMRWPLNLKKELVIGLFRGDGSHLQSNSKYKQQRVCYTTVSKTLVYQLELILAQLGFATALVIQDNVERNKGSKYTRKVTYRLDLNGKFAYELAKLVWGDDLKFKSKLDKKFIAQKAFVDENYVYLMVKSVEKIKNKVDVFNLTVENTHSYLAENVGTYNSANVALQTQLARYKAKRDMFEIRWITDKFLRIMAERNEWYKRDAKEIVGQYRVKRKGAELTQRLIIPKLSWHKKLMMRDDQQFLTFLHNVYSQGKGPISALTLLMAMGLDLETELTNKTRQRKMEELLSAHIQTPAPPPGGGLPGLGGALAKITDKFRKDKTSSRKEDEMGDSVEDTDNVIKKESKEFTGESIIEERDILPVSEAHKREIDFEKNITQDIFPVNNDTWYDNINSPNVPQEVIISITAYDNKLRTLDKKHNGKFKEGVIDSIDILKKHLIDIYLQGKLKAYTCTDFLPVYRQKDSKYLQDYSDIVLSKEFEDWITDLTEIDLPKDKLYKHLRDLSNTCFCYGQLRGFQEQGIYNVKISNTISMDGIRYKVDELTKKGKNMASLISPYGEIVLFNPCIEGFEDPDFGNMVDSRISVYKDAHISGIQIENCPIEFLPHVRKYIDKLGKYIKENFDTFIFVKDIVDLPEWSDSQYIKFKEEFSKIPEGSRGFVINSRVEQEKMQKRGKVAVFKNKKCLYISNWIGVEDTPITENLIKHISIQDEALRKNIEREFKEDNFNLSKEDINTYNILGYLDPVRNSRDETIGWKISNNIQEIDGIDERLIFGKTWSVDGICPSTQKRDPMQLFNDNLRIWIDYPHKLSNSLSKAFNSI